MSKWSLSLVAAATAMIAIGSVGTAHAEDVMTVNVPFAFQVGRTKLPAGSYLISQEDDSPNVLTIVSADGARLLYQIAIPWDPAVPPAKSKLVFAKAGHQYFLSRVEVRGGESSTIRLSKSGIERAVEAADAHR